MDFKYNPDVKYKQNGSYSVKTQPYNLKGSPPCPGQNPKRRAKY